MFASNIVGLDAPLCIDTMSGLTLQSMSAKLFHDIPGKCEPTGGVPTGSATPKDPQLFCCRSTP
jgi:hypothetical protein